MRRFLHVKYFVYSKSSALTKAFSTFTTFERLFFTMNVPIQRRKKRLNQINTIIFKKNVFQMLNILAYRWSLKWSCRRKALPQMSQE